MAGNTINQHHSGTGDNIVADVVNVGHARIEMTEALLGQIAASLDKTKPVAFMWIARGRTQRWKTALHSYLIDHGFQMGPSSGGAGALPVTLPSPISVFPCGIPLGRGSSLMAGLQVLALDATLDD